MPLRRCCEENCKETWNCTQSCNRNHDINDRCYCWKHLKREVGKAKYIKSFRKEYFDKEMTSKEIIKECYGEDYLTLEEL